MTVVANALVDAFVVAAEEQKVAAEAQLIDPRLTQALSIGGQENDFIVGPL